MKHITSFPGVLIASLVAAFVTFTVALGVVLLSRSGGVNKFTHYLVGDLLSITSAEVGRLAVACALIAVWLCWSSNRVLFTGLNETLARSRCAQHC